MEQTDLHFLGQVMKVNINSDKSCWQYIGTLDMMWQEWHFTSAIVTKTHKCGITMRNTSEKSHLKDNPENMWSVFLKIFKVIKNQESLKNCQNRGSIHRGHNSCPVWEPETGDFSPALTVRTWSGSWRWISHDAPAPWLGSLTPPSSL